MIAESYTAPSPTGATAESTGARAVCACALPGDGAPATLSFGDGPDWRRFMSLVKQNQILAGVYRNREGALGDLAPRDVLGELRTGYLETVQHNLWLRKTLTEALRTLADAGIDALPYKGPLMAEALYGDSMLRQCWDLDFMLRSAADAHKAMERLRTLGYARSESDGPLDRILRRDCELTLVHDNGGPAIELHWRLLPRCIGAMGGAEFMWSDATACAFDGAPARQLSPEATLAMLVIHGGLKHAWSELRMICDVALWLRRHSDLGVFEALDRAGASGHPNCLAGVLLARRLFDAPLTPEDRERLMSNRRVTYRAALALGRLFSVPPGLPPYQRWKADVHWLAQPVKGFRTTRSRYLRELLEPEFGDRYALPSLLPGVGWVHYLTRIYRLLQRHGVQGLRRV